MNIGFNKKGWAPGAKITVYKLFVRSILEYGMQIHLYEKKDLVEFEKTQFLALRILYGVPWNTSKNALKRLSCIESMKCRNEILNAKYIRNLKDEKIPACKLMNMNLSNTKSIYYSWRKSNSLFHRLINISDEMFIKEINTIKYENINLESLGHSNISDAIMVVPNLKKSSILFWNGLQDAKMKSDIIDWRLGRIAYHQKCFSCNAYLSRKHAISCSGADVFLENEFPMNHNTTNNIIDGLLNKYFIIKKNEQIYVKIYEAIQAIKRTCLGIYNQE